MSKPTQAQIEAATAAVYAASEKYPRYATIQMNMILAEDYAKAALTAAAEVGGQWSPDIHGTKSEIWDTAVATTIERCAKEAERYDEIGATIAAAIRKLKEGK